MRPFSRSLTDHSRNTFSMAEWHTPRRRVWTKIISILISVTFIFPYLNWAFESDAYPAPEHQIMFDNRSIEISKRLGTVTQSFQAGNRLVVHIQDLHCNYEVQNNIAKIIDALTRRYGLRLVTVEGASRPIDVSKLSTFPLETVKRQTGDYLMKQGKITGAEMYAATGKHPIWLEGIESSELYEKNRTSVMKFLNNESQGYIYDLRETLDELKTGIYNARLASLDEKKQVFREGGLSLLKYSVYLYKYGARQKLILKAYPNLSRYVSRRRHVFSDAVDADELFREMEQLDQVLRAGMYTGEVQVEMDVLQHRLDIMEKLLNISATPEELAEFRANPEGFRVRKFLDYIRQHEELEEFMLDAGVYGLDRYLEEVKEFYRIADERSLAFVENTLNRMRHHHTKIALLVTGGFHTQEIASEVKARGISYVCVKPCLRHQDIVNPYFALLRNRRTPLEKLLAQNQNILSLRTNWKEKGLAATQVQETFRKLVCLLLSEGTIEQGVGEGNNTLPALEAFYKKTGKDLLYEVNWENAQANPDRKTYFIPFAEAGVSLALRPAGDKALDGTVLRLERNGFEAALLVNDDTLEARVEPLLAGERRVHGPGVMGLLTSGAMAPVPMMLAGGCMAVITPNLVMHRFQTGMAG